MPLFGHLWPDLRRWVTVRRRTAQPSEVELLRVRLVQVERERDRAREDHAKVQFALKAALPAIVNRHNGWISCHTMSREKARLIEARFETLAGITPGATASSWGSEGDLRWPAEEEV